MIKIENLSTVNIVLQFEGSVPNKHLHSNAVIKLSEEEFACMVEPSRSTLEYLNCLTLLQVELLSNL